MKIFITGATGFVGGHIITSLQKLGHKIYAVSRYQSNPILESVEWLNCKSLKNEEWLSRHLNGIDVVIHLAAYAHQTRNTTEEDRKKFFDVNKSLTTIVYRVSCKLKVRQFIFISSIGAIKSLSESLITEDTCPEPDNDYGESKLQAEQSLRMLEKDCFTKVTIVRPCLVYGFGNPGNMNRLSKLIDTGIPLPFLSINSKRSFLYVHNLTNFIITILLNKNAYGEDFILADEEVLSLPEIIRHMARAKGKKVILFPFPKLGLKIIGKLGDMVSKFLGKSIPFDSYSVNRLIGGLPCSINKSRELLGWNPPYKFKEAIEQTFKVCKIDN